MAAILSPLEGAKTLLTKHLGAALSIEMTVNVFKIK